RIRYLRFNLDNQRLDVFGASVISRRHHVLYLLGFTFHYFRRRKVMVLLRSVLEPEDEAVFIFMNWLNIFLSSRLEFVNEESRLAELKLGNPGLDKPVLDKLEASFEHD
nr:hypothetical protein [Tanacetum cinerariifolium]